MKWFKHMTASGSDPKLSALIDCMGMEGYGLWWRLLEIVGMDMDDSDKCEVTYSLPRWSLLLYCHHHKASKFLVTAESLSLIQLVTMGSNRTVKIHNMLKFRDSHTKNLQSQKASKFQVTCKQEGEGETEGEVDKEKEKTTPPFMSLFEVRKKFRDVIGTELGGGVNQSLSEICKTYTPDKIDFALLATSTTTPLPKNPFMYFKAVLEGDRARKEFVPKTYEELYGEDA
jgi:hypothetical protein